MQLQLVQDTIVVNVHLIFLGQGVTPPPAGHHIAPSQQGAPEPKGAICMDRVVTGRQHTQVPPHQVTLSNTLLTVVSSKPHIRVVTQIILETDKITAYKL